MYMICHSEGSEWEEGERGACIWYEPSPPKYHCRANLITLILMVYDRFHLCLVTFYDGVCCRCCALLLHLLGSSATRVDVD